MTDKWISGAIKHKGSLRRALHVKKGEKIPHEKLEKAEHSKNKKLRKKAILAETLSHMHHGKKKKMSMKADKVLSKKRH